MPTYTKEELEAKLAARGNGGSSRYNPFKADGINVLTGAQLLGLGFIGFEKGKTQNQSPAESIKAKRYGLAFKRAIKNLDPRESTSGKVLVVSTALAGIASVAKRKGRKPIHAGIFKLA